MRAKVICKWGATLLVVLGTGFGIFAHRDIGGGSGRVKTPYTPNHPATVSDVTKVKFFASKTRTINDVVIAGTHVTKGGQSVALMFVKGNAATGIPLHKIEGTQESGANVVIDLSEVESLVVSKDESNASRVVVEVTQFPAITPTDLIEKKPSYTDLRKNYTRNVRLHVKTYGPGGRFLCLVAKSPPSAGYRVVARFSDLATGSKVNLGYGTFEWQTLLLPAIWWATGSVTSDQAYPFRVHVRSRN
ncbi:MAG TPA: hypothetical protein VFH15_09830 [Pyrinomonadaceae bacterium]|nr:hypothetical protein [Pyrinomonadaceae bacterium]